MTSVLCPDAIVACCTAREGIGGAIAMVRVSGPDAITIVDACAQLTNKKLIDQPSHTIHHGFFIDHDRQVVDEVLFQIMLAPRTFTGENIVEITCHNNAFIIDQIISLIVARGARLAERGEFTRQAVCNKKIDLVQAEAIHDLICATNALSVKASLAQLAGSMSYELATIEQQLIAAIAWCEASFEFIDEVSIFSDQIKDKVSAVLEHIASIRRVYDARYLQRDGFRIALLGAVNAGKSSLFNALIGKERAIVAPIAGTTRDTIEARVMRQGMTWTLIDTAGLRDTTDSIERAGIERSWNEAQEADVLLLVLDRSQVDHGGNMHYYHQLLVDRKESIVVVYTKSDLLPVADVPELLIQKDMQCVAVSAIAQKGIHELELAIADRLKKLTALQKTPYVVNQRQYELLLQLEQQLKVVLCFFDQAAIPYELVSLHVQQAVEKLGEISGKTVSDAALDRVFKSFCIGK
jgi:tRNA modification GTPase